jgi:hypothetical protein
MGRPQIAVLISAVYNEVKYKPAHMLIEKDPLPIMFFSSRSWYEERSGLPADCILETTKLIRIHGVNAFDT